MLNQVLETLPVVPFSAQAQTVDLPQGMYIERLQFTLAGTVDIAAGGGADGVALTEQYARLIREITIKWDTFDLVQRISGRDLVALSKRGVKRAPSDVGAAVAPGIAATAFSRTFYLYFARPWLVNPFDTVLPPLPVNSQFKMFITWETGVSGVGGAAGSGAFVAGGTRAITFTVAPTLTIVAHCALRGKAPWAIPVISSVDSDQFVAANPRVVIKLTDARAFDSALLAFRNGPNAEPAELLTDLTFQSQGVRYFGAVPRVSLHEDEQFHFPGVGDALDDTGYLFLLFAAGGWLGSAVEPSELVAPRFELNTSVPIAPGGNAHILFNELLPVDGLTLLKPR